MLSKTKHTIAAIILSGGQGSRLGGKDKGLQDYNGKALIAWVIEAISSQVDQTIISINRNIEAYKIFNLPTVIDDTRGEFNGPIAGILSASKALKKHDSYDQNADYILIASCDSPNLPTNYVGKLYQSIIESDLDVALVHDGKRNQNLHCLINIKSIPSLQSYFNSQGRSMHGWFKQVKSATVDFSSQTNCFININSMHDLAKD